MLIKRRKFLVTSFAIGANYFSTSSLAQVSPSILERIRGNRIKANQLRGRLCGINTELNERNAKLLINSDYELRNELLSILEDVDSALNTYILKEHIQLGEILIAEDLLLPVTIDREPNGAVRLFTEDCEPVHELLFDIIIEAFSLQDVGNVLKELIVKVPGFDKHADDFAKSIHFKDWEQAIDIILIIIKKLSDANMFVHLNGQLKVVYRKVLAKLGARFVPFVGWVYTGITFATAIYSNSERIVNVVGCAMEKDSTN